MENIFDVIWSNVIYTNIIIRVNVIISIQVLSYALFFVIMLKVA